MRIADKWQDYTLLDTSDGMRLERWGPYTLVRPDPQVLWTSGVEDPAWGSADATYHRSSEGGGKWSIHHLPERWAISYDDLSFYVKTFSFKHTGLFPEQAVNWDLIREKIRNARERDPSRDIRVLNLFAYTGGATAAAASAGAFVTHVDASHGMVTWANENMALSGLADAPIRWIVDDCMKFVTREIRREHRYDAIILDPPSYGRGPKGELWKLEDAIFPLLQDLHLILTDDPLFVLLSSYTTGLQPGVLHYLMGEAFRARAPHIEADELGLPVTNSGLVLPCGASGIALFR